jgi:S1-C subfamily serine protease
MVGPAEVLRSIRYDAGLMRALIVEDDQAIAAFVARGLRESGFAVDHTADGESGLEMARLKTLALGNSDAVQVGDVVLAVGNPLGIGQTVTMGIVSAKGRSTGVGDGSYEDFLQTDAPINQGNSGGALVNMKGELVGINSQILSVSQGNIGIGFAIPANMARDVMDDLRTAGRVRRAQLGVTIQPVTADPGIRHQRPAQPRGRGDARHQRGAGRHARRQEGCKDVRM